MRELGDQIFCDAFMLGYKHCEQGIMHTHENADLYGPAYTRGYRTAYEIGERGSHEQRMGNPEQD